LSVGAAVCAQTGEQKSVMRKIDAVMIFFDIYNLPCLWSYKCKDYDCMHELFVF
jgi:hypothetical protein